MALSLGSSLADKIYLGATEINLAYFGATQIYTAGGGAFSAEAQDYFDRLDTAGDTTYTLYKQPLANYIDGLVALGGAYWDTAVAAGSLVGVGIEGVVIPLRSGMPTGTNNNFLSADLNQATGLKGTGAEWIATGAFDDDTALDDVSISCWITESPTLLFTASWGSGILEIDQGNLNQCGPNSRNASSNNVNVTMLNYMGHTRTVSTGYDYRFNGLTGTLTSTSGATASQGMTLFGRGTAASQRSNPRIAIYHYGPALNDATLEALQATLMTEVKQAEAVSSYFSRLDAAGDTTYIPYKQPLTNYIEGLVALGGAYWDTMLSACSFVGVGIEGIVVPLRSGMTVPTNNNFISSDLSQTTGLLSSGTEYIDTGLTTLDFNTSDTSISVHITTLGNPYKYYMGAYDAGDRMRLYDNVGSVQSVLFGSSYSPGLSITTGLHGTTRTGTAEGVRANDTDASRTSSITTPTSAALSVFATSGISPTTARLATYHAGPALNLATLEALQDTLITEIAAI